MFLKICYRSLLLAVLIAARTVAADKPDAPGLPAKSHVYVTANFPRHVVAAKIRQLDNTPDSNPLTDAGATLGRVLFYDRQLSKNDTTACASCHLQENAFTDPRQFSRGFADGNTMRNSMSLANLRFTNVRGELPGFFWDERAATLEAQVLMPIQDKVEMGMELPELEEKLRKLPYYPPLFQAAFGSPKVTSEGISKAVAQFMRSMVSFDSRFDRAAVEADGDDYSMDFAAFTPEENLGKKLFIEGVSGVAEIGCAHCHVPPTFAMPKSFNIGLDFYYVDQGLGARDVPSNDPFTTSNDGKFRAPSLRNIALTAPYMHDGRFETLEQVIQHYSSGVHPHVNVALALDATEDGDKLATSGFVLADSERAALVAFLKTLTDDKFIHDPRFADPFVRLAD
ncbi:MAG: cytochrome-c peroxidase [Planctomycetaceae bacterium]|nr:cytochrome-c peroxidase [Planctomycetaceae bacterium]